MVAGIELGLPFIEQGEGCGGIADFVTEVVRDAAIGIDVQEILAQGLRKEPCGYGKIFVVGAGELAAVFLGFGERGGGCRDGVASGQTGPGPAERYAGIGGGCRSHSVGSGYFLSG